MVSNCFLFVSNSFYRYTCMFVGVKTMFYQLYFKNMLLTVAGQKKKVILSTGCRIDR